MTDDHGDTPDVCWYCSLPEEDCGCDEECVDCRDTMRECACGEDEG